MTLPVRLSKDRKTRDPSRKRIHHHLTPITTKSGTLALSTIRGCRQRKRFPPILHELEGPYVPKVAHAVGPN